MTMHSFHPDSHEHGLADDCPRCQEHADDPVNTLDQEYLARIMALAVHPERFAVAKSHTDLVAAASVLNVLERAGHLARTDPDIFAEFLTRYGVYSLA